MAKPSLDDLIGSIRDPKTGRKDGLSKVPYLRLQTTLKNEGADKL